MPTMKIHEQITPENWCQGRLAENDYGEEVPIDSPTACYWCAIGWLEKTYDNSLQEGFCSEEIIKFQKVNQITSIGKWNDSSTLEEVKAAFLKADL